MFDKTIVNKHILLHIISGAMAFYNSSVDLKNPHAGGLERQE